MRGIWGRRNAFIFEKVFGSPGKVVRLALLSLEEHQEANNRREAGQEIREGNRMDRKWKRPMPGLYKLNFDAAVDLKNRRIGIGIVIRDSNGEVMVTVCSRKDHVISPFIAECQALKRSIDLCKELGFGAVMMEGDAKGMIETVLAKEADESEYGQLIEDTKRAFAQGIHWSLSFIHREGNSVAHSLAKKALLTDTELCWIEESPQEVIQKIVYDRNCNFLTL
ncbi:hypothetical protein F2P56_017985 [Juglans regia]|uniref:RNase H type-1 domain-containing protein n=2 Tax=Juglans regia TaxID=51240 RepID=A0A833TKY6_JUGRE|nr:uncharacterized protein LOC109014217 [Juglans regia]KAF5461926.1 hypothetical protein F2P56_017985 [Juglans regia]